MSDQNITNQTPPVEETQDFKSIFTSKTFWVTILALFAFIIQSRWGYVIDESTQVQILAVVNICLRTVLLAF